MLSSWGPWSWQPSSRATSWRTWCSWSSWRTLSSYFMRFLRRAPVQARPTTSSMTSREPWPCASAPSISQPPRAPSCDTFSMLMPTVPYSGFIKSSIIVCQPLGDISNITADMTSTCPTGWTVGKAKRWVLVHRLTSPQRCRNVSLLSSYHSKGYVTLRGNILATLWQANHAPTNVSAQGNHGFWCHHCLGDACGLGQFRF